MPKPEPASSGFAPGLGPNGFAGAGVAFCTGVEEFNSIEPKPLERAAPAGWPKGLVG